jgi:hypothetical protein
VAVCWGVFSPSERLGSPLVGEVVRLKVLPGWGEQADGPAGWVSEVSKKALVLFKLTAVQEIKPGQPVAQDSEIGSRIPAAEEGEPPAHTSTAPARLGGIDRTDSNWTDEDGAREDRSSLS